MSKPHSNEQARTYGGPPRKPSALALGGLALVVVFASFAAYAFLTPPVYRTSAQVAIDSGGNVASTLTPLEAARRLHEAVLDRDVLSRFSNEQAPSAAPEARIQIARAIQAAFQIDSVDGRTFNVSFRDSDRNRAARRCNELAARAIERGPRLLAPGRSEEADKLEAERRKRLNELVAFLAAHPELAAEQQKNAEANGDVGTESSPEPAPPAPSATGGPMPPPHAGRSFVDLDAPPIVHRPPAVIAEWQRLLAEVSRARVAADKAKPKPVPFKARLLSRAVAPLWPVEPDRKMLLSWGGLAGLGAFALIALLVRGLNARTWSSFPPPTRGVNPASASSGGEDTLGSDPSLASPPPLPLPSPSQYLGHQQLRSPLPDPDASEPLPLLPRRVLESSPPPPPPLPSPNTSRGLGHPSARSEAGPRLLQTSSSVRPGYSGMRSERAFRAAAEVDTDVAAPERRADSSVPPSPSTEKPLRTTQVLGSPVPPVVAPGSRRTRSTGKELLSLRAAPFSEAPRYRDRRTPPPPSHSDGPSPPPPSNQPTTVSTHPAPPGWRADLSLLPESRRALCDEFYPHAVDHCLVIAVVGGAGGGEDKARLTAELALALAESGHPRVLVIEGNLQRPQVQRFLRVEVPAGCGLSEQLQTRIESLQRSPFHEPWAVVECSSTLHVLAEGNHRSPQLILSRPFESCVRELRSFYDFILLDGPSVSEGPACSAINDVVDIAVLRTKASAQQSELARTRTLFPNKTVLAVSDAG